MRTVHKFPLALDNVVNDIQAPLGRVLLLEMQGSQPCLWIEVFTEREVVTRRFHIFGTGQEIPDHPATQHVGSFQEGPFVWHVYEDEGAWRK